MGVWELNLQSYELTTSRTCREMFGGDGEGLLTFAELQAAIHPDDAAVAEAARQHSIETGGDYAAVFRTRPASGRQRWVEMRGQIERTAAGTPRSDLSVRL